MRKQSSIVVRAEMTNKQTQDGAVGLFQSSPTVHCYSFLPFLHAQYLFSYLLNLQ